ncbi:uncharacterized protein [Musca autumnalis]|uniref:uncharacterized protein n=1 Tax=Musca autumnalis TaxID=221902 RepID=UPI003CF78C8A
MVKQKLVLIVLCYVLMLRVVVIEAAEAADTDDDDDDDLLKSCSLDTTPQLDCPPNSLCTRINPKDNSTETSDLKCICLQNYHLNPKWDDTDDFTPTLAPEQSYCIPAADTINKNNDEDEPHKIVVYIRSSANPQHLVFGIIMILLGVTLVTAVLYGIKVLRPVKRTKAAYKMLKNRRQNITPLQEMDELEMNRRYEMQTF